jgi:hypothetical protein
MVVMNDSYILSTSIFEQLQNLVAGIFIAGRPADVVCVLPHRYFIVPHILVASLPTCLGGLVMYCDLPLR